MAQWIGKIAPCERAMGSMLQRGSRRGAADDGRLGGLPSVGMEGGECVPEGAMDGGACGVAGEMAPVVPSRGGLSFVPCEWGSYYPLAVGFFIVCRACRRNFVWASGGMSNFSGLYEKDYFI